MKSMVKMERKAAITVCILIFSSLLANGNRIKEISKAMLKGIRMAFAKIKIAKRAKIVAIAKNIFLKEMLMIVVIYSLFYR